MKLLTHKISFTFAAVLTLSSPILAQDTGGVSQEQTGAAVKGKAPVAKELLRVRFPKPKTFTLSNGLKVYVLESHRLPAVRLNLQIRAGTLFEPKPGVASVAAQLLTEGTPTRTGMQLAEQIEGMGAGLSAMSGIDTVNLSASGMSDSTDALIELMADVLMNPTFPVDRLDRVKFMQRSMSAQRKTNPTGLLGDLSSHVFYGGTKFGRVAPTPDEIGAITREDLVAFHRAFYKPNGAILGVTGDVNLKNLQKKLEAAFRPWKADAQTAELPDATFKESAATRVYLIDRPNSAQTVLQFGSLAVKQGDPDYIALTVANRILGGGSAGRLFQNIRERKGYTYGAYSSLSGGQWPGIWGASASVRTEVTEPATAEFFNEFKRLQTDLVPEEELDRAKRSILGSFALTLESPDGILGRTLDLIRNGLPMNYWDAYPKRIQAVTAEDVRRVARKYLGAGRVQVMAVGERKAIEAGLAKFGPVTIVDPDKMDFD